tara:strand:+ start:113 stop:496 length:384 start_codon:yes stop_codon:yes gene_type:complete
MSNRKLLKNIRILGALITAIGLLSFMVYNMSTGAFILLTSGISFLIAAFIASIFADTADAKNLLTKADYRLLTIEDLPSLDNTPKPRKTGKTVKKGSDFDVDAKASKPKRKYKKRAPRRKKPAVKAA